MEHLHWLRDMVWNEDKSTIRTGNAPQVISALTNLVISLFRIQKVTKYAAETRRNAQTPAEHSSSSPSHQAKYFDESLADRRRGEPRQQGGHRSQ
jgi:hypothetical protein